MHLKPNNLTLCTSHDPVSVHTIFPDTIEVHIDVSQPQVIMGRSSFMPDVYPMTNDYHLVDPMKNNTINDSVQIEIPKQVMDVLSTCSISNWTCEPYHQNLNLIEWKYRTIKFWTNNVMNESDASSNYWLLCIICGCYLLSH